MDKLKNNLTSLHDMGRKIQQASTICQTTLLTPKSTTNLMYKSQIPEAFSVKIKSNGNIAQDQEIMFRIKIKILRIIRSYSEHSHSDLDMDKKDIQQLLNLLNVTLRQKIVTLQKKLSQEELKSKRIQVQKINLQAQIDTNQIQIMKFSSKSEKNLRIIAQDRQRFQKKMNNKQRQNEISLKKMEELTLLNVEYIKTINQLQQKINTQTKQIQQIKKDDFAKQKRYLKQINENKKLLLEHNCEIQNLKQSMLRSFQQKNQLTEQKNKIGQKLQIQKQKKYRLNSRCEKLQCSNEKLSQQISHYKQQNKNISNQLKSYNLKLHSIEQIFKIKCEQVQKLAETVAGLSTSVCENNKEVANFDKQFGQKMVLLKSAYQQIINSYKEQIQLLETQLQRRIQNEQQQLV